MIRRMWRMRLRHAALEADIILTTGGVSVGKKDIFHQVLPLMGAEWLFWRIAMKPGQPAAVRSVSR